MKTTAIICELNPIHAGHATLLRSAKEKNDVVIAVMSGHFTQRAIPAVFDKYARADAALACGADLVLELPFPWCSSGAEHFARGGVAVGVGCGAESFTFGSESGDIALLEKIAAVKSHEAYNASIRQADRENRDLGCAALFEEHLRRQGITDPVGPNDKLGAEYIRFAKERGVEAFYPVRRMAEAPSATSVREVLDRLGIEGAASLLPEEAYDIFRKQSVVSEKKLDELLFQHGRLYLREEENDLLRYGAKIARQAENAEQFIKKLPTKKYTLARLRREILFHLTGIGSEKGEEPAFTMLLGANERGRAYLSEKGKDLAIPVLTKPADDAVLDERARAQYARHRRADELYATLQGLPADAYMKRHPVIR